MKVKELTIAELNIDNIVLVFKEGYDTIVVRRQFGYAGDDFPDYLHYLYDTHTWSNFPGSRVGYTTISKFEVDLCLDEEQEDYSI